MSVVPGPEGIPLYRAGVAQNIYDDPEFLERYVQFPRQQLGLDGAPEWPAMRDLLPPLAGKRVLDLGCGFGWFSRWAAQAGAEAVLGVDVSERMLDQARSEPHEVLDYQLDDLEMADFGTAQFDVAFSSLALHYIADLVGLFERVHRSLRPDGVFVFSAEHPIFTAPTNPAMIETPDGMAWPLNEYGVEGERIRSWLVDGVRKQHRTVATWVNTAISAGFVIERMIEFAPSADDLAANPGWKVDQDRPPFLILAMRRAKIEP